MDQGRKYLWHRYRIQKDGPGESLAGRATAMAVGEFWELLGQICRTGLPAGWRQAASDRHPILRWQKEDKIWVITRYDITRW